MNRDELYIRRAALSACIVVLLLAWVPFYNTSIVRWLFSVYGRTVSGFGIKQEPRTSTVIRDDFNNPPDIDVWCGKAYRATDKAFDPGGRLDPPKPAPSLLLDIQAYTRMSIYLNEELSASFIIDATLSATRGHPYCTRTSSDSGSIVHVAVFRLDTGVAIIDRTPVLINSTSNELPFSVASFAPQLDPYELSINITTTCADTFSFTSSLTVLPLRTDGGSTTKLDRLYGGLLYQRSLGEQWVPIFPFSFYVSWGDYLVHSPSSVDDFAAAGFNIIHPIPPGGPTPFPPDAFTTFLDRLDDVGLPLMYDMRHTYMNLSLLTAQVTALKSRKSLLLWYTADEPDGPGDPLTAPQEAYTVIRRLDPYHPTSLVLNCANFHYAAYSAGADIVLADPYPIAVNTRFSTRYGTVCNETYGCCGCDNCAGGFADVSARMDALARFESWLGGAPAGRLPKAFWGVPQAFGGSEFWERPPTPPEEVVMVMLFVNHGAKGIVAWTYPTTEELAGVMGRLAQVLTERDVTNYLLGAERAALGAVGSEKIDAVGWRNGKEMLVSVVYTGYELNEAEVAINLPGKAKHFRVLWPLSAGSAGWRIRSNRLVKARLPALDTSLIVVSLE